MAAPASRLQHFIARGMLPKELPPSFSSTSFATAVANALPPFAAERQWVGNGEHSLARPSGVRRILSIPNPIGYVRSAIEVATHWRRLKDHFAKSPWSASSPTLRPRSKRAAGPTLFGEDTVFQRARCRATASYVLRADVSEFYRSVYTHSIPWALVGKSASKTALRTRQQLWCDALDQVTQWGQDGQTNGIPVGPDTSFVLGEVILSTVDELTARELKSARGYRYYDDYEIAVGSRGEAEGALHRLQDVLATFGLQLNPAKTKILELPLVAEGSLSAGIRNGA
jgi:hypothetical protein